MLRTLAVLALLAAGPVHAAKPAGKPAPEAPKPGPGQTTGSPEEAARKAAIEAAGAWLELVDAEKYAESWDAAAAYFRSSISREQWEKALQSVRAPLGEKRSRAVESATFTRSPPGAPDGQYVVIRYRTSFAGKESAVETVTPMLDGDGKWRVSGYYIQ